MNTHTGRALAILGLLCTLLAPARADEIHDAATKGDVARVRALLDGDKALMEARNDVGMTPLILAAGNDRLAVAAMLLNRGASISARDVNGDTALHLAAYPDGPDVARLLLKKMTIIDARNNIGQTPLQMASALNHARTVSLLLARGADPVQQDKSGHSALDLAPVGSQTIALLRPAVDVVYLHRAANQGDVAAVRAILDKRPALLEARNARNETPLWSAAIENRTATAKLLLERGADPNALCLFNMRVTPLMCAAQNGQEPLARLLLTHGAKVDIRDSNNDTALHMAAEDGHTALVRLLLAHGADTRLRDARGLTPLDAAVR
ncbi:MAG: ankyrin repeat domain-containing protein, partial [Armatimonadota bacterium]|nr:ankyrin repeat domain-containing protein [Armatimonadota bacterium]